MHVTLTLDERKPQDQAVLNQLRTLAQAKTRRRRSPFPFSVLEWGVDLVLAGTEWAVQRLVAALVR